MTRTRWAVVLALTLVASIGLAAQSAQELYQRALVKEHADGDLTQAIELYGQVARQANVDRALAARALRHLAAAHEKLGRASEATSAYAELIGTYPEQHAEVAIAQGRLAALRRPGKGAALDLSATDAASVMRPLIDNCLTCHSGQHKLGGLDLEAASRARIADNTELWEKVTRRLQARRDPPFGVARPGDATYAAVVSKLEHALDAAYTATRGLPAAEHVTDVELAVRLAAFLWNAQPDAALLDAARRGDLRDPVALERHVLRMIRDTKASALVDEFFAPWLSLNRVRNASAYPQIDRELLQSMDTETRLFLQSQLRDDRDAVELWTAGYTYVNEPLAHHYGLTGITGKEFRRVTWPNANRAGLLGQAAPLTALSTAGRTSPTKRGLYVLTHFLGIEAPNPPANIPALDERPASPSGTLRDRMMAHRSSPVCANCHTIFDPLGFGLENFDATGAWRTMDSGSSIDASGFFPDGTRFDGPAALRSSLLKFRQSYYTTVTQRLLAHALNRSNGRVYDYEMPAVRQVVRDASTHGYRWSFILAGICASPPFQMKHMVP